MCDKEAIKSRLNKALETLAVNDAYLLESNLHERSLTHKLGCYLTPLFPEWDVDCEYNKDGNDPKKDSLGDGVLPDVIIHKRGHSGPNLLLIEAKKKDCPEDRKKIEGMANLDYRYGVFVDFNDGNPEYDLYVYETEAWEHVIARSETTKQSS